MKLLPVYSSRIHGIGREKAEPNSGFLQPSNHLSHFEKRHEKESPQRRQ